MIKFKFKFIGSLPEIIKIKVKWEKIAKKISKIPSELLSTKRIYIPSKHTTSSTYSNKEVQSLQAARQTLIIVIITSSLLTWVCRKAGQVKQITQFEW